MSAVFSKIESLVLTNKFALLIILGAFLLRFPSLFEPLWYLDEAIYAVIGQEINRGSLLYADIFDHKTPGIYYLAAWSFKLLGHTIWSFKFLLLVWMIPTFVVFYAVAKKLFDKRSAIVGLAFLAILTSTTPLEGNTVNSEILMILPTSIGILLTLSRRYFLAGLVLSLSFLLKFTGIFDFGAVFVLTLFTVERTKIKEVIKNLFVLTAGWVIPITIVTLYFVLKGAFGPYINSVLLYNIAYTSYGNSALFSNSLLLLKILPVITIFGFYCVRSYLNLKSTGKTGFSSFDFVLVWFFFAFYAAVFGGRPYEHYLIQAAAPFALLIGAIFYKKSYLKIVVPLSIIVFILVPILEFRPHVNLSYYANFFSYLTGQKNFEDYSAGFGSQIPINYAIATYLRGCREYDSNNQCLEHRAEEADVLYIFATEPAVYFLSELQPASRYTTFFHVAGTPEARSETAKSIRDTNPGFVLVQTPKSDTFDELENILDSDYNLHAAYENFLIYELKSDK